MDCDYSACDRRAFFSVSDRPESAWLIASKQYGNNNIVSVLEDIDEQKKAPSAEQLRIKSLDDQAKRYRDLARQLQRKSSLQIQFPTDRASD